VLLLTCFQLALVGALATAAHPSFSALEQQFVFVLGLSFALALAVLIGGLRMSGVLADADAAEIANAERRVAFESPAALIAVLDRDGRVIRCNAPFGEILGGARIVLPTPSTTGLDLLLEFASAADVPAAAVDVEVMPSDSGAGRKIRFSLAKATLPDGRPCTVAVGQDETRRRREDAASAATARLVTLGGMTTSIAHELSQPLNAIYLAAGNALDEIEEVGRRSADLPARPGAEADFVAFSKGRFEVIIGQVERAARILARMRVFGRRSNDEGGASDVAEICRSAVATVEPVAAQAGIEIRQSFPSVPILAATPQMLIQTAIVYLLRNACEAISAFPESPKTIDVSVRPSTEGKGIVIRVADSGPGILAGNREKIFEPFFTTKAGDHIGLGLSLAFGAVHDAGGKLSLVDGPGTVFEIEIPAMPS